MNYLFYMSEDFTRIVFDVLQSFHLYIVLAI